MSSRSRQRIHRAVHELNRFTQGKMDNFPQLRVVVGDALAEQDHCCEWRAHAYTCPPSGVIHCATALGELPSPYLYGVLAHEFGHELAHSRWGEEHSEAQANQIVREWLGLRIHIDSIHYLQHLEPAQVRLLQRFGR